MQKNLFSILFLILLFISTASALEVTDLSQQIDQTNSATINTIKGLEGKIITLDQKITALQASLDDFKTKAVTHEDFDKQIFPMIHDIMADAHRTTIMSMLMLATLIFAGIAYSRSKRWL
jgi:predicted PurR-regulated permease PerM